jgi:outer membrane murein-binding lipoprotein Lpp
MPNEGKTESRWESWEEKLGVLLVAPTRVGPVQVSEQVSDLDAENQRLKESLENARETIDNLKQDLAETNYLLDQMTAQDPGGNE